MWLILGALCLDCRLRLSHDSSSTIGISFARVTSRPALHVFLPQYWLFDLLSIQYLGVLHQIRQRTLDCVLALSGASSKRGRAPPRRGPSSVATSRPATGTPSEPWVPALPTPLA